MWKLRRKVNYPTPPRGWRTENYNGKTIIQPHPEVGERLNYFAKSIIQACPGAGEL